MFRRCGTNSTELYFANKNWVTSPLAMSQQLKVTNSLSRSDFQAVWLQTSHFISLSSTHSKHLLLQPSPSITPFQPHQLPRCICNSPDMVCLRAFACALSVSRFLHGLLTSLTSALQRHPDRDPLTTLFKATRPNSQSWTFAFLISTCNHLTQGTSLT